MADCTICLLFVGVPVGKPRAEYFQRYSPPRRAIILLCPAANSHESVWLTSMSSGNLPSGGIRNGSSIWGSIHHPQQGYGPFNVPIHVSRPTPCRLLCQADMGSSSSPVAHNIGLGSAGR
jgi:hypothetical protein